MTKAGVFRHIISMTGSIFLILTFSGCNSSGKNSKQIDESKARKVSEQFVFSPEYMQEGFINHDTFRVVIITPANECNNGDLDSIESRARTRALSTLKQYIETRGWNYSDKTRDQLSRLITSNGSVSFMDRDCSRDSVYVYDIKKGNIQDEIDLIATRR